ncbi:hypothetical protein P8452_73020 [Trifolium repens]|nr:hypothetical protein P8452_73020 [Trifolium repens]
MSSSSSSSCPILCASFNQDNRSKRSSGFLGSIIPDAVNDVLDPAYHHVLHNAVPAGVKSSAVICKVENVTDTSSSELLACRANMCVITYNGYFQEYNLNVDAQKLSWSLERETNLLNVTLDKVP